MSFWVRESYTTVVLKSIPSWLRITITSCLIIIFVGSWWCFFYYPLMQRQHFLEKSLIALQNQQKSFDQKLCHEKKVQTCYDELSQKIALFSYAEKQAPQELLYTLMHEFRKHNLICKKILPSGNKINTLFTKQYVFFDVKGPFKDIKLFLHDLSAHDFLKYKKIALLRRKNNMIKCQALVRAAYLRSPKG